MQHRDSLYPEGFQAYSLKPDQIQQMVRAFSKGRKSNVPSEGGTNTFNPTPMNISDRPSNGWSTKLKNESPLRNRNIRLCIDDLDNEVPEKKRAEKARRKVQAKIKEELEEKNIIRLSVVQSTRKRQRGDDSSGGLDDSSQNVSVSARKRRGRKRERDDKYFDKAWGKINEIKRKLKTAKRDGITVNERQRLRN